MIAKTGIGDLTAILDDFKNYLFKAAFGLAIYKFKDYCKHSETYAPQILNQSITDEIKSLVNMQGSNYLKVFM